MIFDPADIGIAAAKGYAAGIVHGAAPWATALAAYEAHTGAGHSALHLAAAGHRNALAIVQRELAEVTGCPCGADELCTPDCDPPTRRRLREALQALLAALEVPAAMTAGPDYGTGDGETQW